MCKRIVSYTSWICKVKLPKTVNTCEDLFSYEVIGSFKGVLGFIRGKMVIHVDERIKMVVSTQNGLILKVSLP